MDKKRYVIALRQIEGIGDRTIEKILSVCSAESEIRDILFEDYRKIMKRNHFYSRKEANIVFDKADSIIDRCNEQGIHISIRESSDYPAILKQIENPPIILYYKGILDYSQLSAAVIGTRTPTKRSSINAERIGRILAIYNVPVVSGLAEGIDTAAHIGCLDGNGKAIAVLAHGLDMIYPDSNIKLSEKIISNNGALVSEYEPGIKPERFRFIQRDRIQAGLSEAVIVVQTTIDDGTMHTVKFAEQFERSILVVKTSNMENIEDVYSGNIKLIEENKEVLASPEDLRDYLKASCNRNI